LVGLGVNVERPPEQAAVVDSANNAVQANRDTH
jgi:hypothetical protein